MPSTFASGSIRQTNSWPRGLELPRPAAKRNLDMTGQANSLSSRMESIEIAGTPLAVSRIGLGTWAIGGWMWGGTDEAQSIRTIHEALDRGITLFDTAPVYGFGRSEEILGKALAQNGRGNLAVNASKVGLEWRDAKPFRN